MTEQPRGSVAYRLQHACRNGDLNPDAIPTGCLAFVLTLLAPVHNKTAAIATSHHQHTPRTTLYVKDRGQYGTADPT